MRRQDSPTSIQFQTRNAELADAAEIARIYGHHVAESAGTFEEVAPTVEEIFRRIENVKARGLPWRVAEADGKLLGYAYASPYHTRSAYKFTVQTSIYVDRSWLRKGVGLALLQLLLTDCETLGYCQVMAAVGDSRNEGPLRLHARAGFRTVGHALRVGVKFGRWVDVVYLQRSLRDPSHPPSRSGPSGYVPPSDQTGP